MVIGNLLTTFAALKKTYGHKSIRTFGPKIRLKKLESTNIQYLLDYWNQAEKFTWPNQPWYMGTGLHYNPKLDINPLSSQVCGNTDNHSAYQDTMSFDTAIDLQIDSLITQYKMVRSKITCFSSKIVGASLARNNDWHRDETPFEALRIIIPLQTADVYKIQLDNSEPVTLDVGFAYAFDQSQYHRVLCNGVSEVDRIHMIISLVTWYDYQNADWIPNSNWGKIHPLDVFESLPL